MRRGAAKVCNGGRRSESSTSSEIKCAKLFLGGQVFRFRRELPNSRVQILLSSGFPSDCLKTSAEEGDGEPPFFDLAMMYDVFDQ